MLAGICWFNVVKQGHGSLPAPPSPSWSSCWPYTGQKGNFCDEASHHWYDTHPICSMSSLAWVMMLAPVKHTMPAISMEYQRALMETHRQHQVCSRVHVTGCRLNDESSSRLLPFPHDVAVERVENTLVSQLQRIVQDLHVFAALDLGSVSAVLSCRQFLLPHLKVRQR